MSEDQDGTRIREIQQRLDEVQAAQSERDSGHKVWADVYLADVAYLLAQLTAREQERDAARQKHVSIARKAGILRDTLVTFTDDDSFAEPIVDAARLALGEYDQLVHGDGEYIARYRTELIVQRERAEAAEASLAVAQQTIAEQAKRIEQWRGWAQFVYLGGGPATGTDAELQAAVCEANDAEIESHKASLAALQAELTGLKEQEPGV